ncbi:hypothetical protein KI387_037577, partial [Taxus chinensis]
MKEFPLQRKAMVAKSRRKMELCLNGLLNERIVAVELHKEATDSYLAYAMSVLLGRALPDVRDGLKPVHWSNSVLGKFHPHGDTVVFDALVRKAQEIYAMLEKMSWEMKVAGYFSDSEHVLSERKVKVFLCHHSEKMAIAFGLLSLPRGTTLRVVKNLN